jgi:NADH:ubiquinone oxidoreductase subunit K
MNSLTILFIVAWLLLVVGIYGLMSVHSLFRIIIALQLMVKGSLLILVASGGLSGQLALGQSLAITVISVDTLVMVIGLALVIQVKNRGGSLDVDDVIHEEV